MKNILLRTRKILSILCVLLLISTLFSSIIGADGLNLRDFNNDKKIIPEIFDSFKDKVQNIKQKLANLRDSIRAKRNNINSPAKEPVGDIDSSLNLKESMSNIAGLLSSTKSMMFFTNYNGKQKQTELKFFKTVLVDVNDDGKDDLSVKYQIFPSIAFKELSLSINLKLVVKKLVDFPDPDALLEAYVELYLPGMLVSNITGDRIRFGYSSPAGEQVPDTCEVTYKFIPNIFKPNRRIGHHVVINPGSNIGSSKLDLIWGYADFENETLVSDNVFRVEYNPAVKSEISIGGYHRLGGSSWEFEKISGSGSDIDMFFSHFENNTYTIFIVLMFLSIFLILFSMVVMVLLSLIVLVVVLVRLVFVIVL